MEVQLAQKKASHVSDCQWMGKQAAPPPKEGHEVGVVAEPLQQARLLHRAPPPHAHAGDAGVVPPAAVDLRAWRRGTSIRVPALLQPLAAVAAPAHEGGWLSLSVQAAPWHPPSWQTPCQ